MRIQESSQQGCVVLTLVGRLELAAVPQLQRAILKQLAEQPPAIICDLGQVEAIDPLCAKVFTSIRHPALSARPLDVAELLALGEVVPADVDAVGIGVVAEGDGNNVGHAVLADRGQPPEPLAPEVLDLGVAERAHGVLLSGL
jgi:hypothetical protein